MKEERNHISPNRNAIIRSKNRLRERKFIHSEENQKTVVYYSYLVLKKHSKHSKIFGTSLNKFVTFFFKTAQACSMGFKSGE